MYQNYGFGSNASSCLNQNPYEMPPFLTPFDVFSSNLNLMGQLPYNHSNLMIQTCAVCLIPIQTNWTTTNIQIHAPCYKHVYQETVTLQVENGRLKNQITGLINQLMILKTKPECNVKGQGNTHGFLNVSSIDITNTSAKSVKEEEDRTNSKTSAEENISLCQYYKDNCRFSKTITYKVAIGNLPEKDLGTMRSALKEVFSEFGTISKIWINPINKLYGFIEYEEEDSAARATQKMGGKKFLGKMLEVDMPANTAFQDISNRLLSDPILHKAQPKNPNAQSNRLDEKLILDQPAEKRKVKEEETTLVQKDVQRVRGGPLPNEQEKKIASLKLIVNSQKQVIMKHRVTLKKYEDKWNNNKTLAPCTPADSSIATIEVDSTEQSLRELSIEMKENIKRILQKNLNL